MTQPGSQIMRNVSLLTLSVGVTMVISLALRFVLPRVFGPEKLGAFYLAESYGMMFFTFLPLGLSVYINRFIPSRPEHARDILPSILVLQCVVGLLISFVLLGYLLYQGRDSEMITASLLMGGYAAIFIFQRGIYHRLYIALDQVVVVSWVSVVVKLIVVIGCLSLISFYPTLIAVAAVHLFSELVGVLILLHRSLKQGFLSGRPSLVQMRTMLAFSLPFYLASMLNGVYAEVNTFMLGHFANDSEIGYYGSAFKLIGVFLLMIPILSTAVTPPLSQAHARNDGSFDPMVRQMLRIMLMVCLPMSAVLTLFGDRLSGFLYGPGFESSYPILCNLTPVLTMICLNSFLGSCHYLISSGRRLSYIFVMGIVVLFALDAFVIPYGQARFGVGGAGIACALATLICESLTFVAMVRLFPARLMDKKTLWHLAVVLLPSVIGMIFYEQIFRLGLWERFAFLALIPIYALLTGLVSRADIILIRELAMSKLKRGGQA